MMFVERQRRGGTRTEQSLVLFARSHRRRRPGAADMAIEAYDEVGRCHDDVEIVRNQQYPALEIVTNAFDQLIQRDLQCGILLISHDLHVVMAATDRVVCLNGHVCCAGTPTAVASSEDYKALFGARAASTLAVYEHHHDHFHLPDGRVQHGDNGVPDYSDPEEGHHGHGLRRSHPHQEGRHDA